MYDHCQVHRKGQDERKLDMFIRLVACESICISTVYIPEQLGTTTANMKQISCSVVKSWILQSGIHFVHGEKGGVSVFTIIALILKSFLTS